jgi:CheY-like chemotaxis protein
MALVLIVEDETPLLVMAERVIQSAGHQTLSAGSYDSAMALFEQGERPDLAFIDRNLGKGLTGIDIARAARQYHPNIHVLYTFAGVVTDGLRAMFVEGSEFLPKPYTDEQLSDAVNKLLQKSAKP